MSDNSLNQYKLILIFERGFQGYKTDWQVLPRVAGNSREEQRYENNVSG